jgi:uncharacterized protein YkwD
MSNVGRQMRNIVVLLFVACLGIVAGFTLGVFWSASEMSNVSNLQALNTITAAKNTIGKQNQQLQQAYQQITMLSERLQNLQIVPTTTPQQTYVPASPPSRQTPNQSGYTGDALMQAVNKYRREHGVPELQLHSGLCQLASRRLGELINLGDLDNHTGFEAYFNQYEISDISGPSLSNVAENLASGYNSAWEAVMGWDSSPPHRTFLLADGSYKYGCGAANLGYAVLIGGF